MSPATSRLLVLGQSPLPTEPRRLQGSGNLRTWHFVKPLLDAGHEVCLVAARVPGSYDDDTPPSTESRDGRLHYISVDMVLFNDLDYLQAHHDRFAPDALIGVNTYPSSRLVGIETEAPIWCDLNGWPMAEAQTKAATYDDDTYLSHFYTMETSVLDRADVISTVSQAQAFATVGELAVRGRLGKATLGYEFCRHIPNAVVDVDYTPRPGLLRGSKVPEDAFVVLWAGGYNTWTDVDLLFDALAEIMETTEDIHFVSTGGALLGHDEVTFETFRRRIAASPFEHRTHFVGWVPTEHVPSYYEAADLGINVDTQCYETTFGARNRINDMLKAALPMLTTRGTEISRQLADRELVLSAEIGQADAFAERILWGYRHRDALRDMGRRAADFARQHYSYAETTAPLVRWAESPQRAPDLGQAVDLNNQVDFFTMPLPGAEPMPQPPPEPPPVQWQERCHELEERLETITSSKMWRLWMAYVKVRRWILRDSPPMRPAVPEK